jgi:hypothetical protein
VQSGGKPVEGLVRDVSAGGLSLQAPIEAEQGDSLRVLIPREGTRPAVQLQAIVWHVRTVRSRGSGKTARVLGLVLSDAPDAFLDLLESLRPSRSRRVRRTATRKPVAKVGRKPEPPAAEREASPATAVEDGAPPGEAAAPDEKPEQPGFARPRRFQVRIKMSAQPRTRSILVFADGASEARETALREAGEGWRVLAVEARD